MLRHLHFLIEILRLLDLGAIACLPRVGVPELSQDSKASILSPTSRAAFLHQSTVAAAYNLCCRLAHCFIGQRSLLADSFKRLQFSPTTTTTYQFLFHDLTSLHPPEFEDFLPHSALLKASYLLPTPHHGLTRESAPSYPHWYVHAYYSV